MTSLSLAFGLTFSDLFWPEGLARLDRTFFDSLRDVHPELDEQLAAYRQGRSLDEQQTSKLLIETARFLDGFLATLFGLQADREAFLAAASLEQEVLRFKREFVKKRLKGLKVEDPKEAQGAFNGLLFSLGVPWPCDEASFAHAILPLVDLESRFAKAAAKGGVQLSQADIDAVHAIAAKMRETLDTDTGIESDGRRFLGNILSVIANGLWVLSESLPAHDRHHARTGPQGPYDGRTETPSWISFRGPVTLDPAHLVPVDRLASPHGAPVFSGPRATMRARDGFALTDRRMTPIEAANEIDYCIFCHEREKDSCRRGMLTTDRVHAAPIKKPDSPTISDGKLRLSIAKPSGEFAPPSRPTTLTQKKDAARTNPMGLPLTGCPLDERISEMHTLAREGLFFGALAMICVDNPMCAGTGHRICNDCMRACIFQKQEPVNIPQIETHVLSSVVRLRFGAEIYGLLTRWNPLSKDRPYPAPPNGKNVLVVGLGPAGYTLSHYLQNEGFGVVAIDGLKIEPFDPSLLGDFDNGEAPEPIEWWQPQGLESRTVRGFGGVAEYGITHRWDKSWNDLLALIVMRRPFFRAYDGVRFGGTLTIEDAWAIGFDHIAFAQGAGKPTLLSIPNGLARGVRQASDFLMALQLSAAFKADSLSNMQVRLPAVVVGGGLTAIDAATELQAFYVVSAERTLARLESLECTIGRQALEHTFDREEWMILTEHAAHGRLFRQERNVAKSEARVPRFGPILRSIGGVTVVYRKRLEDSPAYRINHEEVIKAFEEGILFAEKQTLKEVLVDEFGAARALVCSSPDGEATWPARTILVAAGTMPNTSYDREHRGLFAIDRATRAFLAHGARVIDGRVEVHPDPNGFFTNYCDGKHLISFFGDNHARYAGSVVSAMASAKDGARAIRQLLDRAPIGPKLAFSPLARTLDRELRATVIAVHLFTNRIAEIVLDAPRAARQFRPGQFFRLQNYERDAPAVDGTRLVMEGVALTGARVDGEKGTISLVVLDAGVSTRICRTLRAGQRVVLMGPTGTPTDIVANKKVVLAGGGLGNAVLLSIGNALRANGSKVLYFAGFREVIDVTHAAEIEQAADCVIWSTDNGPHWQPSRPGDGVFTGNIVDAMKAFALGQISTNAPFSLGEMEHLIVVGSDRMMRAIRDARLPDGALHGFLKADHGAIASINSPMQCMMKEICAQCLQRWEDPSTGAESYVFTCAEQDQPLDCVDFGFLASRLRSSSAQEKLSTMWLGHLVES